MCVELLMIVLEPYLFKGLYEYDPDLGFRVRAYYPVDQGTITNKFGFNDDDYPLKKHPVSIEFWLLATLSVGLAVGKVTIRLCWSDSSKTTMAIIALTSSTQAIR